MIYFLVNGYCKTDDLRTRLFQVSCYLLVNDQKGSMQDCGKGFDLSNLFVGSSTVIDDLLFERSKDGSMQDFGKGVNNLYGTLVCAARFIPLSKIFLLNNLEDPFVR